MKIVDYRNVDAPMTACEASCRYRMAHGMSGRDYRMPEHDPMRSIAKAWRQLARQGCEPVEAVIRNYGWSIYVLH